MIKQVIEFNEQILGIQKRPIGMMPDQEIEHLRMCLEEEARELTTAHGQGDLIGCVDALIDSVYFALGGLHKMGISSTLGLQIFESVHEANMTKKKGKIESRDTGAPDAVKPPDWVPPEERIAELIDAHMAAEEV